MSVHAHSLRGVTLVLVAPPFAVGAVRGFARDEPLRVARNAKAYRITIGIRGQVSRARSRNLTGRLEFALAAASEWNRKLSLLAAFDWTSRGLGVFAFVLKDRHGADLAAGSFGWIDGQPPLVKKATAGSIAWGCDLSKVIIHHGGGHVLDAIPKQPFGAEDFA